MVVPALPKLTSFTLSAIMALLVVGGLVPLSNGAGPAYTPGVAKGYFTRLATDASWTSSYGLPAPPPISDLMDARQIDNIVTGVSGTGVTAEQYWVLNNATGFRASSLVGDVSSGTGNFSYWIIAGGLTTGQHVYNNASSPTINSTTTRTYFGNARTVNILTLTLSISSLYPGVTGTISATLTWDQTTGVLLELYFSVSVTSPIMASGYAHAVVGDTNIFETSYPNCLLLAEPFNLTIARGSTLVSRLYGVSFNNFLDNVTLRSNVYPVLSNNLPNEPSASVTPAAIAVSSTGSQNSSLSVTASLQSNPGLYRVNVTAQSPQGGCRFALVFVTVVGSSTSTDFVLTAQPLALTLPAGSTGYSRLTLTSYNDYTGFVYFNFTGRPAGMLASASPDPVLLPANGVVNATLSISNNGSVNPGIYNVNVTALPPGIGPRHSAILTVTVPGNGVTYLPGVLAGNYVNYTVQTFWYTTVNTLVPSLIAQYANVTSARLDVTNVVGTTVVASLAWRLSNQTATRQSVLSADVNSGLGNLTTWVLAGGLSAGQTIVNEPTAPRVNVTTTRVYVEDRNVNIANFTFTFSETVNGITVNGFGELAWTWDQASGAMLEQYYMETITGAGQLVTGHSDIKAVGTNIPAVKADFTIVASLLHQFVNPGGGATVGMTLTSTNGFAGTIQLSSAQCTDQFCITPSHVTLSSGQKYGMSSLHFSASTATNTPLPPGDYTFTVVATSGGLSHSVTMTFTVLPDFSLEVPVVLVHVNTGASVSASFTVSFGQKFSGPVNITASGPAGLTLALSSVTVTGSSTVRVNISAASGLKPGNYTVTLVAKGGPQTHSGTIMVVVSASPNRSAILGLMPVVFYFVVGTVIAGAAGAAVLLLRRKLPDDRNEIFSQAIRRLRIKTSTKG